jgi:hypothetical protein
MDDLQEFMATRFLVAHRELTPWLRNAEAAGKDIS